MQNREGANRPSVLTEVDLHVGLVLRVEVGELHPLIQFFRHKAVEFD